MFVRSAPSTLKATFSIFDLYGIILYYVVLLYAHRWVFIFYLFRRRHPTRIKPSKRRGRIFHSLTYILLVVRIAARETVIKSRQKPQVPLNDKNDQRNKQTKCGF